MQKWSIAESAAVSGVIDIREWSGAIVITPAAWTAANIGIQVAEASDGTFVILRDKDGVAVQVGTVKTDGARGYALPTEVFAAGFIKLWSKNTTAATETDTNQAAARTGWILLKG